MSFTVKLCTYGRKGLAKLYRKFATTTGSIFSKSSKATTPKTCMAAVENSEKTEQLVLKEHGLSEIMSDTVHTPTQIGQTPVHSPIIPELPERYIRLEGQVIPYEWDYRAGKYATSYTITPSKPNEYIEIFTTRHYEVNGEMMHERVSLGPGKHVQFYDENGNKLGAVVKVPRTSKMSKEEFAQYLAEAKKNGIKTNGHSPKPETSVPLKPKETLLEKAINGLQEPKGTAKRLVRLDNDGNTIVRFLNKGGSTIRKIKLNSDGQILEYTNFRTLISDQGIKGAGVLSKKVQFGYNSRVIDKELPLEDVDQFEEAISKYMRIRESSKYILGTNGEVVRTIQTRRFTPHIRGQVGEPFTTTVDARSMGDGRFVEDVVITKGDKRFSRSFWFHQKTGNVYTMDGWCKGLTKEEIELIKSDPFLASRYYNDGLDFVRAEKFNAYKTQGLRDKQTPLEFETPEPLDDGSVEYGHYQHYTTLRTHRHLNMTPEFVATGERSRVTNTMHHEPRHGFQHQMEEDLNAGLLQGEEASQAQIFRDNFANYKTVKKHGFKAYYEQPVEVDARKAGEAAENEFKQNGNTIFNIFNKAA